jgi:hypothetical protein
LMFAMVMLNFQNSINISFRLLPRLGYGFFFFFCVSGVYTKI